MTFENIKNQTKNFRITIFRAYIHDEILNAHSSYVASRTYSIANPRFFWFSLRITSANISSIEFESFSNCLRIHMSYPLFRYSPFSTSFPFAHFKSFALLQIIECCYCNTSEDCGVEGIPVMNRIICACRDLQCAQNKFHATRPLFVFDCNIVIQNIASALGSHVLFSLVSNQMSCAIKVF